MGAAFAAQMRSWSGGWGVLREGGMPPAELEGAQLGMLGVWYLACLEPSESVYARPRMPRGRPFAMSCVAHGRDFLRLLSVLTAVLTATVLCRNS